MYIMQLNNVSYTIAALILGILGNACCDKDKYKTYEEFKYISHAEKITYERDSIVLDTMIQQLLDRNEQAFYPDYYDQDTDFQISEILYSPDKKKFVFFVTTFILKEKLLKGEADLFVGLFFIGEKDSVDNIKQINWERLRSYSSYDGYEAAWQGVRKMYLEFSSVRNSDGTSRYLYNIDDIRFWDCRIWEKEYIYNNGPTIVE